ncbi:MAG TPA: TetR/AcrR family transcriptional regulator [Lachnoclostridium sp.]|jgi:AcrR family transcriptional regulator|uniref:TetR/AcrR family transcriptional regulator n=1 Tax=Lacrimispora sp. TaxID=2719234 RepID=UPI000EE54A28|nr:TetR/AcrR family transcriptional regulator [Lacrimispora sp.]HCD45489.1 TetR/AcrR family transcriptional regulator [Lachnoclostridium sp.]
MRIIKDSDVRKNEILDAAADLFNSDGFDGTTISAIIEKAGIARGTIYYHFKSKEDILDALIQRRNTELLTAAKQIAADKSTPVLERLLRTFMAMNGDKDGKSELTRQMHKPQNALMHQKTHQAMMEGIPPILMEIIEDGISEGLFNTPYPYESLEMVVAHVNAVFDDYTEKLTGEELLGRVKAFIFNLERLFGAEPGGFDRVIELFQMDGVIAYE